MRAAALDDLVGVGREGSGGVVGGTDPLGTEWRGKEGRRNGTEGPNAKGAGNGGVRGGRLNEKIPRFCSVPSDGDPVASVGVFKVCTKPLVSIGYGAALKGYSGL